LEPNLIKSKVRLKADFFCLYPDFLHGCVFSQGKGLIFVESFDIIKSEIINSIQDQAVQNCFNENVIFSL